MRERLEIAAFEWEPLFRNKTASEDALFTNRSAGVLVVADGVTRGIDRPEDAYPDPSPARLAAHAAAQSIGERLSGARRAHRVTVDDVSEALRAGNSAVRALNETLGFWGNHNYLDRDLAGTVAAGAVVQESEVVFGYIGDCGIAFLSPAGDVAWRSDDDVAAARPYFPTIAAVGREERFVRVRRDFRNNPTAPYPTFGVLTGEETALPYIKTGRRDFSPGEAVAIYSDGMAGFIYDDADFRNLLVSGRPAEIRRSVADRSSAKQHPDDKTLIIARALLGDRVDLGI